MERGYHTDHVRFGWVGLLKNDSLRFLRLVRFAVAAIVQLFYAWYALLLSLARLRLLLSSLPGEFGP